MKKLAALFFLIAPALFAQSVNGIANQAVVGNPAFVAGSGAANVLTACPTPAITAQALVAGFVIHVRPNAANTTTTPTFNICSLGAVTIVKGSGGSLIALAAGDYATGVDATFYYTGSFWQLMNPQTGAAGIPYPGAGIPNSTGTAWGTSYTAQGTDTKVLTAGTVSGTSASLCTDANGGATTVACPSGGGGGAPSIITVQETTFQTGAGVATTFTLTFPQQVAATGNTMFMIIACDGSGTANLTISGWTTDISQSQPTNARLMLVHKTTAGETSVTITAAANTNWSGMFFELKGSHSLDQVLSGGMANATTLTTPAITPSANSLVFSMAAFVSSGAPGAGFVTNPILAPWNTVAIGAAISGGRTLGGLIYRFSGAGASITPPPIITSLTLFAGGGVAYSTFSII